jgi:uncharacterized protein YndB with AHSA1/START domain
MGPYIAKVKVDVKADINSVWKALTDASLIKQYFFGTNVVSDWKKGSAIRFHGEWEGKAYEDKGTILESDPPDLLKYNYWSSMSGTPDTRENYSIVTYALRQKGSETELTVTQDEIASEEARDHSEKNWRMILESMSKLIETK